MLTAISKRSDLSWPACPGHDNQGKTHRFRKEM
jgi:hypothetical protein